MSEIRYAILIGINDYKSHELHYCDKDVAKMREQILSKCRVSEENMFTIVSSKVEHRNIETTLKECIAKIKKYFVQEQDSIIFYFSGHGKYVDRSYLEFHDNLIAFEDVYEVISALNPSNQIYIVDACYSGAEIQWKSSADDAKFLEELTHKKFISKSKGTYFLYSSTKDEKSKALRELQGSVFTHYIIEGMLFNTGLYANETNTLSLSILFDYASRKIGLNSGYGQTPAIQIFEEGYYPFCFADYERVISAVELQVSLKELHVIPDEVYRFFYNDLINLPSNMRRDIAQLVIELVLNLIEHGFSPNVELFCFQNIIEIRDHNHNAEDPFLFIKTEDGNGLKVYEAFLNKYKSGVSYSFSKGNPNRTILELTPKIFDDFNEKPCYFKTEAIPLVRPEYLNKYKFNDDCATIVIDATSAFIVISYSDDILDYLIRRTADLKPPPLIILRIHENDMARDFISHLLLNNPSYKRIMMI